MGLLFVCEPPPPPPRLFSRIHPLFVSPDLTPAFITACVPFIPLFTTDTIHALLHQYTHTHTPLFTTDTIHTLLHQHTHTHTHIHTGVYMFRGKLLSMWRSRGHSWSSTSSGHQSNMQVQVSPIVPPFLLPVLPVPPVPPVPPVLLEYLRFVFALSSLCLLPLCFCVSPHPPTHTHTLSLSLSLSRVLLSISSSHLLLLSPPLASSRLLLLSPPL